MANEVSLKKNLTFRLPGFAVWSSYRLQELKTIFNFTEGVNEQEGLWRALIENDFQF